MPNDNPPGLDEHLAKLQAPRPGKRWRERTRELLRTAEIREHVLATVRGYAHTDLPGPNRGVPGRGTALVLVEDESARGYVWAAALTGEAAALDDLVTVIRRAGCVTAEPVWDAALANAAINALGAFGDPAALDALRGLEKELRYPGARKQVQAAIQAAAALQGITPGQLLERGVPRHGLDRDGSLERRIGGYQAVLTIEDPRTVRCTFTGAEGRPLRSVPASLKGDDAHAAGIRELKTVTKEVRRTLAGERARVEGLLSADRHWAYGEWCRHYRDHPLTGVVTRGLIWEFEGRDGVWRAATPADEVLVTVDGNELARPEPGARVRLWHPIRATAPQVRAWRAFVDENAMVQPFKQAFREIYLLTPAEEETGVYSNRFAAHIVRYGQLYALFKERGWQSDFLGRHHDGAHGQAKGVFAEGGWRAVFYHEHAEDDFDHAPAYAATDQVRFERRDGRRWQEAPLAGVPAAVFSEAMRDVDLFVGVTSIAADPEWEDRGEDRHLAYWRETSFGELTASAEVRRDALSRIVPRTRIAGRCSIEGRFLVVRGDLRTYKIHLGSGNILMEPDDSYLCVVASRPAPTGKVFLPFEDERLALILSKAFLLAADTAITDDTIIRQIKGDR
ncbi:DUF4132 domain-containing protein [Actinomadura rugatobispora]|uniref:DUF4132 domain-containing protein n=1 Tax=Actinomadura rugatobispora TaxID=1994 RepID=A0ABW0ZT50_9ACTN|nr:hypothetical protein GCM10010200_008920 [Actinomadura rugatobispora]